MGSGPRRTVCLKMVNETRRRTRPGSLSLLCGFTASLFVACSALQPYSVQRALCTQS